MSPVEMLGLSLGLSVVVAGLGLAGGALVERLSADPVLRDRAWGTALLLPLAPPVATGLLLLTPPAREVMATAALPVVTSPGLTVKGPAIVEAAAPIVDAGAIATGVLVLACGLFLLRLIVLMRRAGRLSALLRNGQAPDFATTEMVQGAARALSVKAPPVVVSSAAIEPLLAGLRPARLMLPVSLPEAEAVRRAIITHELAHLKRGDHRVLWLEELTLALLAINPLMPLLRARRAAAREEACDAVALAGAGSETRRAYAQTLIEALRTRAGSQTVGVVPALTFTGAGRTTAMHRLKAVLSPAAPATRRARIGAVLTGVAGLALVGAGSAALAAQRAPAIQEAVQYTVTARFESDAPGDARTAATGETARLSATATFDPDGEVEPRYRNVSATAYRDFCLGDDTKDKGFCAGVLFGRVIDEQAKPNPTHCAPANVLLPVNDAVVPVMARVPARADEGAYEYAERVLRQIYPCPANRAETGSVLVWVPVDVEGRGRLNPGDRMHVTLSDANGAMLAEAMSTGDGELRIPLTAAEFPGLGQANRAYTLTGVVHRADGSVQAADNTVTLRLSPGSQRAARNMTATLHFGG